MHLSHYPRDSPNIGHHEDTMQCLESRKVHDSLLTLSSRMTCLSKHPAPHHADETAGRNLKANCRKKGMHADMKSPPCLETQLT